MSYTTTVTKGFYDKQWKAETYIDMKEEGRRLRVSTWKGNSGLVYTSVQAVKSTGSGMETFIMFQDFSKRVKSFPEIKRVTEKAIREAHTASLAIIQDVVDEANSFYEKQAKETENLVFS